MTQRPTLPIPLQRAGHSGFGLDDSAPPALAVAPWRALAPAGTLELRRPTASDLRRVQVGAPVALLEDRPLARRRLRRLAARTGFSVERELVVLPTLAAAAVVLDDDESAVWHFWNRVATVPPGLARLALPGAAALCVARRLPWSWTGAISPAHVVLGRRK